MTSDSYCSSGSVTVRDTWMYAGAVCLLTFASAASVHIRVTHSFMSRELAASIGLLSFNLFLAVIMLERKAPEKLGGALSFGLMLICLKVFVNSFTILLLIGLQAVRTPVFVPVFFAGYFVLLASTVWALHRTSFSD